MKKNKLNKQRVLLTLNVVIMLILSLLMIIPFLLMIITSIKTMSEIYAPRFIFIPKRIAIENYAEAMRWGNWPRYFLNSAIVTTITFTGSTFICSLGGYAFARLRFRGRNILFVIALAGLMIPPQATMVPVFLILKNVPLAGGNNIFGQGGIGLINTYAGLIGPYLAGSFIIFLFRQFYLTFPQALDDAAEIDGLNKFKTFIHVYVPLSTPVIATSIAMKATHAWNEYTWPLIITTSDKMKTVQLALSHFRGTYEVNWNLLMAATTIILVPLLIIFVSIQRYFTVGIVTTGIKG